MKRNLWNLILPITFQQFMLTLVIGTNIFAAQYWGKQDRKSIRKVMAFVLHRWVRNLTEEREEAVFVQKPVSASGNE